MGTRLLGEEPAYISTGQLPKAALVRALVDEAFDRFRGIAEQAGDGVSQAQA